MSKRYVSREDYLAEGARLLKKVYLLDNKPARDAYAAWEERAQPSKQEKLAVQAMARHVPNRVLTY